jgi:hypothetical protein
VAPGGRAQTKMWTWPRTDRPVLCVRSHGAERYAPVLAMQEWADGAVYSR